MNLFYRLSADLVFLTHFAFILAVIFGGLIILKWPKLAWVHVPVVTWGFIVEMTGQTCPLTPLEQSLRMLEQALEAGRASVGLDPRDSMAHWSLGRALFLTRLFYATAIAVVNIAVYLLLWWRMKTSQ